MDTDHTRPREAPQRHDGGHVEVVRARLVARAYLFDDPAAYEAGVADALAALSATDADAAVVAA